MGSQKRLLEEMPVCSECGADMSENEDGELECDGWDCMTVGDTLAAIHGDDGSDKPPMRSKIKIRFSGKTRRLRL